MNARHATQGLFIVSAALWGTSARASTGTECAEVPVQTGVSCNVTFYCYGGPDGGCDPDVNCQPVYGQAQVCSQVELATTPVAVYRSHNQGSHYYSTSTGVPAGYVSEGEVFSLANDTYLGAVAVNGLNSGQGYMFPTNDSTAIADVPNLQSLYFFFNPMLGDSLFTTNPNDANAYPCIPAGCNYDPVTNQC